MKGQTDAWFEFCIDSKGQDGMCQKSIYPMRAFNNYLQAVQKKCKRPKLHASGLDFMQPVKTSCKRSKLHASSTKLCASGPNSCLVPNPIQKLELGSTAEKDQQIMASAILAGLLCCDSVHCLIAVTYCSGQSLTLLEVHPP